MKLTILRRKIDRLSKNCLSNDDFGGVVHLPYENFYERAKGCRGLIVPETPSLEEWQRMAKEVVKWQMSYVHDK